MLFLQIANNEHLGNLMWFIVKEQMYMNAQDSLVFWKKSSLNEILASSFLKAKMKKGRGTNMFNIEMSSFRKADNSAG